MAHWYYGENGQQVGPVDETTIRAAIGQGRVGAQTLVWREGMPSWLPLAQVQELAGYSMVPAGYPGAPYAPPYAYGQGVGATSGLAIASLVMGILGLVTCLIPVGIPGVICGHMALKQINESALPMGGRGMAISGLIMSYLQVACCVAGIVALVIGLAAQ